MTPDRNFRAEFNQALRDQLAAIERQMAIFNDHADHLEGKISGLDVRIAELQENDAELKRLILEQGETMRAQGATIREQSAELRALRERLDGGTPTS